MHTYNQTTTISTSQFFKLLANIQRDSIPTWPVELLQKNPNLFDFCYNNPTTYIDPHGDQVIIGIITVGIIVTIVGEQFWNIWYTGTPGGGGYCPPPKVGPGQNGNNNNNNGGNGTGGEGSGGGGEDPPIEVP